MIANTKNSFDNLVKSFETSSNYKSTLGVSKLDSKKSVYSDTDFKKVLKSKSDQPEDKTNIDNVSEKVGTAEVSDNSKVNSEKDKLDELEKESESTSEENVSDVLTELLNLLTRLGIKKEDLRIDSNTSANNLKDLTVIVDNKSVGNLSDIIGKIMELLKNDSVKDKLDTNSLKVMEKILGNISNNIGNKDLDSTKGIKNLISEISDMLNNKENQASNIELGKNYAQANSDSSTNSNDSKTSKEEKFLNSLVDDKKDNSFDRINLFGLRTTTIQNQGTNNVRGLTVNQATFTDDLIKDIKYMNNNSLKELTVKVNPGNLGEITIKLVQEGDLMKANLKVNSRETADLLSQSLSDIKKQLGDQNLKISDVNIELYQGDTTFHRGQNFDGQSLGNGRENNNSGKSDVISNENVITEDELVSGNALNDNNLDLLA